MITFARNPAFSGNPSNENKPTPDPMQKHERIFHEGTYIGSITEHNGLVYAFQAHARPGHPAHYSGISRADAIQWLKYRRYCPVYVGPLEHYSDDGGPRFPAMLKAA